MKKRIWVFVFVAALLALFLLFVRDIRQARKSLKGQVASLKASQATQRPVELEILPRKEGHANSPEEKSERNIEEPTTKELFTKLKDEPLVPVCSLIGNQSPISSTLESDLQKGHSHPRLALLGFIQASTVGLFFQYRLPENNELIIEASKDESFLSDIHFARLAFLAKHELEDNLQLARETEVRNYYAWKLMWAISKNIETYKDPRSTELCSFFADETQPFDQKRANQELLTYLEKMGVRPEEIEFDPHFQSDISIAKAKSGLYIYISRNPLYKDRLTLLQKMEKDLRTPTK